MNRQSNVFKLSPLQCVGIMVGRYAIWWVLGMALILILAAVIGLACDIKVLFVVLMILCMGGPALLAYLYYHYGLYGESYLNIVNHKVEVDEDSFNVLVEIPSDREDEEDSESQGEGKAQDETKQFKSFRFQVSDLGRSTVGKDYVIFPFVGEKKGFLFIPVKAFDKEEDFLDFIKYLSDSKE